MDDPVASVGGLAAMVGVLSAPEVGGRAALVGCFAPEVGGLPEPVGSTALVGELGRAAGVPPGCAVEGGGPATGRSSEPA